MTESKEKESLEKVELAQCVHVTETITNGLTFTTLLCG